jgi:outer membrane protein
MDEDDKAEFTPMFNYMGERFSMVGGTFSYKLAGSDTMQISAIAQGRDDGYKAGDSDAVSGMDEREAGFDIGLNAAVGGLWGTVQVSLLSDVTETSEGSEIDLRYSYPVQAGLWTFETAAGATWKSEELVDYYYGVKESEARSGRNTYQGEAAVNPYAEFVVAYKLSRQWSIVGGVEVEQLDDVIADSPIIDEDYEFTSYSAAIYSF